RSVRPHRRTDGRYVQTGQPLFLLANPADVRAPIIEGVMARPADSKRIFRRLESDSQRATEDRRRVAGARADLEYLVSRFELEQLNHEGDCPTSIGSAVSA